MAESVLNNKGVATSTSIGIVLVACLVVLVSILIFQNYERGPGVSFNTPYQTVLLTNGAAYYGKTQTIGTRFLVLKDVYYVHSLFSDGDGPPARRPGIAKRKRASDRRGRQQKMLGNGKIFYRDFGYEIGRILGLPC